MRNIHVVINKLSTKNGVFSPKIEKYLRKIVPFFMPIKNNLKKQGVFLVTLFNRQTVLCPLPFKIIALLREKFIKRIEQFAVCLMFQRIPFCNRCFCRFSFFFCRCSFFNLCGYFAGILYPCRQKDRFFQFYGLTALFCSQTCVIVFFKSSFEKLTRCSIGIVWSD